ncbi:unnamed protein product, partial [Mesorhabditis spiculigera]
MVLTDQKPETSKSTPEPTSSTPVNGAAPRGSAKALPVGPELHLALKRWSWAQLDGVRIPAVGAMKETRGSIQIMRAGKPYLPVKWVQVKLLAGFAPSVAFEVEPFVMLSHKLCALEALVLNGVNGALCRYSLGYTLLTTADEVVTLHDVARFYWHLKDHTLSSSIATLKANLVICGGEVTYTAMLHQMNGVMEAELQEARAAIAKLSTLRSGASALSAEGAEGHRASV